MERYTDSFKYRELIDGILAYSNSISTFLRDINNDDTESFSERIFKFT